MVGTFDNSAAVAAAIVVEEYVKQVTHDLLVAEERPESALAKPDVQAFALHLLKGLNWSLFREQHTDAEKEDDELVRAIGDEIAVVGASSAAEQAEMTTWIRETVTQFRGRLQAESERVRAVEEKKRRREEADIEARDVKLARQQQWSASDAREPHLRLGVRQHDVSGHPSYYFTMETRLPGDQLVRVRANDFDTQEQAMSKVDAVKETLLSQHERLWSAVNKKLPILKQQLLSADLERSTERTVPKPTMAEKRLLAANDPVKLAKFEHRRQQQNQWRKNDRKKKKAERERRKAELKASALSAATRTDIGGANEDGAAAATELQNTSLGQTQEPQTQSSSDPLADAVFESHDRSSVGSPRANPSIPTEPSPPRKRVGRPRKSRVAGPP